MELQDFRQLTETLFDADVCIVGAGPAGLAIARELADTHCRVLIVESGGGEPSSLTQDLDCVENVGAPRQTDQALVRARAFGGTSSVWNGRCGPLDASDMEAAFARSAEDKTAYKLTPETWRYIRECEPTRQQSWLVKLRRQFVPLPVQSRDPRS